MPITMSPPAIIFINTDLTTSIIDTFTRQLFLTQVMDAATFDALVAADGYYPQQIHQSGSRIMVLRPLYDMTNRSLADIVLFAKSGLVSVLYNRLGPPSITLPIDKVYLTALINLNRPIPRPECRPDLDDGFVGEIDDDNFDQDVPYGTDPPYPGTKSF
jgi:hypothetical protein